MGCEFHHPKIQWQPVLSCYRNQSGGLPSSLPSLLMPQLPGCSFVRRCHQPFGLATVDATRRAGHPSPRTCSARPRVKGVESSLMMSRNHHIADLTNHRPAAARSVRRDRTETSLLQRLLSHTHLLRLDRLLPPRTESQRRRSFATRTQHMLPFLMS